MHKWNLLKKRLLHLKSCSGSNKFSYSCNNGNRPGQQHCSRRNRAGDEEEIAEVPITRQLWERLLMQKKLRQRTRALMRSQRKKRSREYGGEEASGADEFTAEDETEAFADSDELQESIVYVYAGLTWAEYWASEVCMQQEIQLLLEELTAIRNSKGAFDTVTRATLQTMDFRGISDRDNYRGRGFEADIRSQHGWIRILSS